jgi:hypothetical protein
VRVFCLRGCSAEYEDLQTWLGGFNVRARGISWLRYYFSQLVRVERTSRSGVGRLERIEAHKDAAQPLKRR